MNFFLLFYVYSYKDRDIKFNSYTLGINNKKKRLKSK